MLFPLFLTSALFAQLSPYQVNGYAEYLASTSRYPEIDSRLYDQLFHFRLNTYWYPSNVVRGSLQLRMRVFYGNSVEKIPDFLDQIRTNYDFTNLDAVLWDAKNSLGYAQIDRLWLDYSLKNLELTLGRQRIAWGTALVWNVIDLYNPKSVLDFDYEEKPGTDALRLQYYTGPVSRLELVDKPGETFKETIIAGLYSMNAYNYDFYVIGGARNDRWVAGGAWAGDILKAGFRGNFWSVKPLQKLLPMNIPIFPIMVLRYIVMIKLWLVLCFLPTIPFPIHFISTPSPCLTVMAKPGIPVFFKMRHYRSACFRRPAGPCTRSFPMILPR